MIELTKLKIPGNDDTDEGDELAFSTLRQQNVNRCEQVFHQLDAWNPLEWAGAMCGEAGEAANFAKKLKRLADKIEGVGKATEEMDAEELADAIAIEVADVVIYGDLLLARVRRSLAEAIMEKFNDVSEKRGAGFFL